jgi:hypothetical protein
MAAEAFFEGEDGMVVDMKDKKVKLSSILKWYREDFGSSDQEVCNRIPSRSISRSQKYKSRN